MAHQVSREDRIKVVAEVLSRPPRDQRRPPASGHLPHDVARAIAEQILDALAAVEVGPSRGLRA